MILPRLQEKFHWFGTGLRTGCQDEGQRSDDWVPSLRKGWSLSGNGLMVPCVLFGTVHTTQTLQSGPLQSGLLEPADYNHHFSSPRGVTLPGKTCPLHQQRTGFCWLAEQCGSPAWVTWQDRVMPKPRPPLLLWASAASQGLHGASVIIVLWAQVPKPCCRCIVGCKLAPALESWALHARLSSCSDIPKDSPQ
jgi:hypothetical protein